MTTCVSPGLCYYNCSKYKQKRKGKERKGKERKSKHELSGYAMAFGIGTTIGISFMVKSMDELGLGFYVAAAALSSGLIFYNTSSHPSNVAMDPRLIQLMGEGPEELTNWLQTPRTQTNVSDISNELTSNSLTKATESIKQIFGALDLSTQQRLMRHINNFMTEVRAEIISNPEFVSAIIAAKDKPEVLESLNELIANLQINEQHLTQNIFSAFFQAIASPLRTQAPTVSQYQTKQLMQQQLLLVRVKSH